MYWWEMFQILHLNYFIWSVNTCSQYNIQKGKYVCKIMHVSPALVASLIQFPS